MAYDATGRSGSASNNDGTPGGGTYNTNTGRYAPIPAIQSSALLQQRQNTPATYPSGSSAAVGSGNNGADLSSFGNYGGGSGGGGSYLAPQGVTPPPAAAPTVDPNIALQAAFDKALGYGTEQISNRGLNAGLVDQYGVLDLYKKMLTDQRADVEAQGGDYATDTDFNNALGIGQTKYRTDLRNKLNGVAPEGFENTAFGDTSDDAILQAILDTQKGDSQLVLDRAKARGQLNDVGYGRASTELTGQGAAGMGTLQSLGGGVLADYRKQLSTERDNAYNRAGTADFNQPYNIDSVLGQLQTMQTGFQNSLSNDIYKTVGGQQFYTPTTAIGKGGTTQGTINPSKINFADNPLLGAFQQDSARKTYGNNSGSLASTGAF